MPKASRGGDRLGQRPKGYQSYLAQLLRAGYPKSPASKCRLGAAIGGRFTEADVRIPIPRLAVAKKGENHVIKKSGIPMARRGRNKYGLTRRMDVTRLLHIV